MQEQCIFLLLQARSRQMQLTRYTDYALRILILLAVQPEGRLSSIEEVCSTFDFTAQSYQQDSASTGPTGVGDYPSG